MVASSVDSIAELEQARGHLDELLANDPDMVLPLDDQQQIEHAIAVGVATLAGEEAPTPGHEAPTRNVLAKDLRITTDLVLRALQAQA